MTLTISVLESFLHSLAFCPNEGSANVNFCLAPPSRPVASPSLDAPVRWRDGKAGQPLPFCSELSPTLLPQRGQVFGVLTENARASQRRNDKQRIFSRKACGSRWIIRKNCLFGMPELPPGYCGCRSSRTAGIAKWEHNNFYKSWKKMIDKQHSTWYNEGIISFEFRAWWFLFGFDRKVSRIRTPFVLTVCFPTIPKCKATNHPQTETFFLTRRLEQWA